MVHMTRGDAILSFEDAPHSIALLIFAVGFKITKNLTGRSKIF